MTAAKKKKIVTDNNTQQSIPFAAEISKVLQLMIHSLYTNKDIFLRELISNASDACDKLRYAGLTNDALLKEDSTLRITISFDEKAKTITVADNGIGMNREDLIANLGTIARSGTQEFSRALSGDAAKDVNLIGQFGVGFYASFMVADSVTVLSRKAGEKEGWRWESDGLGGFTISEAKHVARGTTITLAVKEEALEYCDKHRLRFIVETYSDHISFPITLIDEEGNSESINEAHAIWARAKADITDEQYQKFYRHIAHSPDTPWAVMHNKVEGQVEYTNLLYIPSVKPFDLFHPERRVRVKLYVKRVFITEEGIDLIPAYLRFLRGIVDSQDLPLNISRETLQKNATLDKIRDSVVNRVLADLKKRADADSKDYQLFWDNFGAVIKEGLCEGFAPREKILEVSRFASTHSSDTLTGLDDYLSRMKEGQQAIYYLIGDSLSALAHSPQLEGFTKRGIEVLLLTDHVDDFWTNVTTQYKGKALRSVTRAGDDLKSIETGDDASESDRSEIEKSPAIDALIAAMKTLYAERIKDVRTTTKLNQSPVCLAVAEGDMDLRMERFLHEHKQLPKRSAKILEINPEHPIITKLAERVAASGVGSGSSDKAESRLVDDGAEDMLWLLFDQAHINEGEPLSDVTAYTRRVTALMSKML